MKNYKLKKSVERLQIDIEDSANTIIAELTEEIETLENRIDELEKQLEAVRDL